MTEEQPRRRIPISPVQSTLNERPELNTIPEPNEPQQERPALPIAPGVTERERGRLPLKVRFVLTETGYKVIPNIPENNTSAETPVIDMRNDQEPGELKRPTFSAIEAVSDHAPYHTSETNGDTAVIGPNFAIVSDGAGGSGPKGADHQASQYIARWFASELSNVPTDQITSTDLEKSLRDLHDQFKNLDLSEILSLGGSATLSLVLLATDREGKKFVSGLNIGDSRVYLRRNEEFLALTVDNTDYEGAGEQELRNERINHLKEQYKLDNYSHDAEYFITKRHKEEGEKKEEKKEEEQLWNKFSSRGNLSSYLGVKNRGEPDVWSLPVEPDDTFIVTSDGVHDQLTLQELTDIAMSNTSPKDLIDAIRQANRHITKNHDRDTRQSSGKPFNIRFKPDDSTIVVLQA